MDQRVEWVDSAKGMAISLVVLYHSTNWLMAAGYHLQVWVDVNEVLSSLRMPLFFAVSGLFAAKWINGSWTSLLTVKVWLYVWVFALWQAIGLAVFMLGMSIEGTATSVPHAIKELLLSPIFPRFELWFIWGLAIFFAVAKLTARVPLPIQLLLSAAVSAYALSGIDLASPAWSGALKYYFFFLVGVYGRTLIFAAGAVRRPVRSASITLVCLSTGTTLVVAGLSSVPGLYFAQCVFGLFAGISIARALARIPGITALGARTLPIYLAHTPIIILVCWALARWTTWFEIDVINALAPLVLAVLAATAALLLHRACRAVGLGILYEPPPFGQLVRSVGAMTRRRSSQSSDR